MGTTNKSFAIRLQVDNTQQAGAAFKGLANDGKAAFGTIGDGADKAGRNVAKFGVSANSASAEMRGLSSIVKSQTAEFESLAGRIPLIGGALKQIGPAGLIAAGGLVAAGTAALETFKAVRQMMAEIQTISNSAKSQGLGVEASQALQLQADLAGVELPSALQKLQGAASLAAIGQGDLYAKLNLTNPALLKQIVAAKTAEDRLDLVAAAIRSQSNETDKINIAQAAFGETGAKLVPILERMTDGVEGLSDAAKRAGLILDQDLIRSVTDANTRLATLETRSKVAGAELLSTLVPAIEAVGTAWAKAQQEGSNFLERFKGLDTQASHTIDADIAELERRMTALQSARERILSGKDNAFDMVTFGIDPLKGISEQMDQVQAGVDKRVSELNSRIAIKGPEGGKSTITNSATDAATAAAAVAKWTSELSAADQPLEKIHRKMGELVDDFVSGNISAKLYASALKSLNTQAANEALKERAGIEKEQAQARADLGDITGLLTIKERELGLEVKAGVISQKEADRSLSDYRIATQAAIPEVKAHAEATKKWTDALSQAGDPITAILASMDDLLHDYIDGRISADLYTKSLNKLGDALVDASVAASNNTPEAKAGLAIREQTKQLLEATLTPAQKLTIEQGKVNDAVAAGTLTTKDAELHMKLYAQSLDDASDKGLALNVTNDLLTESLDGQIKGFQDLERVAVNALVNIAKQALKTGETVDGKANGGVWAAFLNALIGGSGGKSGSAGASAGSDFSGGIFDTGEMHTGGEVGDPTVTPRRAPASLFRNAQRFHKGLAPDEFPAILQRKERVLSADHNERMVSAIESMDRGASPAGQPAKVEVNIHNESGGQVETKQSQGPDGMRQIDVYIRKAVQNTIGGGGADAAMLKQFNVRPVTRQRG